MPANSQRMGRNGPKVSIIVPTKNSAATVRQCLESVRNQTERSIEVLVVDNGSDDSTLAIAQEFADLVITHGHERSEQRNFGALQAKGEYLLFIDSDMVLESDVVTECLSGARLSGVEAVIIPELTVGEGFWVKCRALERSCYVGDDRVEAARFYSRGAFMSVGGYDERLVGGEDWDLSQRVARGASLGRTNARILHDERRLNLRRHLAKKAYYAGSYRHYWRKHGVSSLAMANTIARPAFLRNWRRLIRHPALTAGMVSLKGLELGASVYGMVASPRTARD